MIRIITPFHNVESFIDRCIESVLSQTVQDWTWHLLDDASTDNYKICNDPRISLIRQLDRKYQATNYISMLKNPNFSPEDIIVSIDGDDWLPDPQVFERILAAYADGDIWITYGSFLCSNDQVLFESCPIEDPASIRQLSFKTAHLRTWKLWLWRLIKEEDFIGSDGLPLRCGGDLVWMFAMIEMAGTHSKWLKDINYIYNRSNPLSCFRVRTSEQIANGLWIRNLPSYKQLDDSRNYKFLN
jgi:hypothetical protein